MPAVTRSKAALNKQQQNPQAASKTQSQPAASKTQSQPAASKTQQQNIPIEKVEKIDFSKLVKNNNYDHAFDKLTDEDCRLLIEKLNVLPKTKKKNQKKLYILFIIKMNLSLRQW